MRSQRLLSCLAFLLLEIASIEMLTAAATPSRGDLADLFSDEVRTSAMALSPDGHRVAFDVQGRRPSIVLLDPTRPDGKLAVPLDERFLRLFWISNEALVYGTENEVRAVRADGTGDHLLVSTDDLVIYKALGEVGGGGGVEREERPPRLLSHQSLLPEEVLVLARGSLTQVYAVEVATGKRRDVGPAVDPRPLMTDATGRIRIYETPGISPPAIFPQQFRHRSSGELLWRNLDNVLEREGEAEFEHATEDYYGTRSIPIGFAEDPEVLLVASNGQSDAYSIAGWNLETGVRTEIAWNAPGIDLVSPTDPAPAENLIYDRGAAIGMRLPDRLGTFWSDPQFAQLQADAEAQFPGRVVHLLSWSDDHSRLALQVDGASDGERYFILDRTGSWVRLIEVARRMEEIPEVGGQPVVPFAIRSPDGFPLRGTLTLPRVARIEPYPLVVWCRNIPAGRPRADVNRDIQALAANGLAVLQVDYRGSTGYGQEFLQAAVAEFDAVPLADLRAAVDWALSYFALDPQRVALVGENFGGYLALRALELHPEDYRCAVVIDAPADPAAWLNESIVTRNGVSPNLDINRRRDFFSRSAVDLDSISALDQAGEITRPVLIVQDRANVYYRRSQGLNLRNRLERNGAVVEYLEINGFDTLRGAARADMFLQVRDFLNAYVYDFGARIGPLRVLE